MSQHCSHSGAGTLSHDVSAALKSPRPLSFRTQGVDIQETPAPPPSPVDFGYGSNSSFTEGEDEIEDITQWMEGRRANTAVAA